VLGLEVGEDGGVEGEKVTEEVGGHGGGREGGKVGEVRAGGGGQEEGLTGDGGEESTDAHVLQRGGRGRRREGGMSGFAAHAAADGGGEEAG